MSRKTGLSQVYHLFVTFNITLSVTFNTATAPHIIKSCSTYSIPCPFHKIHLTKLTPFCKFKLQRYKIVANATMSNLQICQPNSLNDKAIRSISYKKSSLRAALPLSYIRMCSFNNSAHRMAHNATHKERVILSGFVSQPSTHRLSI